MPQPRGSCLARIGNWLPLVALLLHWLPLVATLEASRALGDEINRCSNSDFNVDKFDTTCGPPLSSPCFDFSRCTLSVPDYDSSETAAAGGGGPKIYVYDHGCSLSDSDSISLDGQEDGGPALENEVLNSHIISWVFRDAAEERGVLAETYDSACVFIHVSWGEKEPCAVNQPLWDNGRNHVMVNFGDKGREGRPKVASSYAMDAASNMHSCLYRSGYDISIPLYPRNQFRQLANIAPLDRRLFLTTKGTLYPGGHGAEERQSVLPLHDEANGVVVSMHCLESHGEHLLPQFVVYCQQLKETYHDHDYASLMNTTFGLVPAGRSPATFRLAEVMGAGAIPVLVTRDFVPPFREQIDWASFSFAFAPDQVGPEMMATLRAIPQAQLQEMQRNSLEAYGKMFRNDDADAAVGPTAFEPSAKRLIDIILHRLEHRGGR